MAEIGAGGVGIIRGPAIPSDFAQCRLDPYLWCGHGKRGATDFGHGRCDQMGLHERDCDSVRFEFGTECAGPVL